MKLHVEERIMMIVEFNEQDSSVFDGIGRSYSYLRNNRHA